MTNRTFLTDAEMKAIRELQTCAYSGDANGWANGLIELLSARDRRVLRDFVKQLVTKMGKQGRS